MESLTHQSLIVLRTLYTLVRNLGSNVFERIAEADALVECVSAFFDLENR
jgi:hypothetical protein